MKVRKLNEEGQKQFEEFIERTKDGESLPIPLNLLSDPKTSAAIADDLEVQKQTFESRYEIGLYLVSLFKHIEIEQYIGDRGFWDWFALYWFDQICEQKGTIWLPDETYNYLLSENFRHRPRHAVYTSWQLVNLYNSEVKFSLSKLTSRGEICEQLMSTQDTLASRPAITLASTLYSDAGRKEGFKRGAAGNGKGSARRYKAFLSQIKMTYYIDSMSKEDLSDLLPKEFNRFKLPKTTSS
jgi:hypothetical protein